MGQYYIVNENLKIVKIDENIKPTDILDHEFLFYANDDVKKTFPYLTPRLKGKWIMRFKHSEGFDQKWKDCCKVYDEGKLTGIRELGCSTSYKNPQSFDHTEGIDIVLFFCGPTNDEENILEYGQNLLKYIPYFSDNGLMTYETDEKKGSKTTKLYQLSIPSAESTDVKVNQFFLLSNGKRTIKIDENENKIPTEITDYEFLGFKNTSIYGSFTDLDQKLYGSWRMYFKHTEGFDQKWKECCTLYGEGKLTGIRWLMCTTGFINPNVLDQTVGEIIFYCGPANDKFQMLEFGKILLKHIPYFDDSGFMHFESNEPITNNRDRYFVYQIPVPKNELSDVKVNRYFLLAEYINNRCEEFIEIDDNKAPTEILDYAFVRYRNMNILNSFPNFDLSGQWMMFFKKEDFDQKWKECCKLYDEGKLTGIRELGCSTGFKNVRTDEHDKGVLMFFCGPATDRIKMLNYGRNLLEYIPFFCDYGFMAYKTAEQSDKGTKATGNRDNSLYRILVPMEGSSDIKINQIFLMSETEYKGIEINENKIPTEILDYEFINYSNRHIYNEIYNSFSYETRNLFGCWRMYFKHAGDFDQKWKECCKLYDEGKLTGIQRLKCSTACQNPMLTDLTTGVIFFYSGPKDDRSKMLECGRNLLKYIPYCNNSGFMEYGHKKCLNNIWYRIPVPKDVNSDFKVNRIFLMSVGKNNIEISENRKPTEILDHDFLGYVNMYMYYSFLDQNPRLWGKWVMNFKYAQNFDKKWEDCCNLYDDGKLIGIRRLKCSTGFESSIQNDSGVILFYCGSMMELSNVLEYGENLLKYITYYNDSGFMEYRSADDVDDHRLYRIPVPKNKSDVEMNQ